MKAAHHSHGGLFLTLLLGICSATVQAQLDDVAATSWGTPQLDAVQMFATEPLCLVCAKPSDLTMIPGIGRASAIRICNAVRIGASTLEVVADSACLTTDQRMLLYLCTTLQCSCDGFFTSAQTRMRSVASSTPEASADLFARSEITTKYGSAGALYRNTNNTQASGAWLFAKTNALSIGLGDVAVQSGLGLVNGAGGSFGSSLLTRLSSLDLSVRVRPWRSSYQSGSYRGVGLVLNSTPLLPVECLALVASRTTDSRTERAWCASLLHRANNFSVALSTQQLNYSSELDSKSMMVIPTMHRAMYSAALQTTQSSYEVQTELAVDDSLHIAWIGVASTRIGSTRFLGVARYASPDLRNPYAAPISSLSAIGNEMGIGVAMQMRPLPSTQVEAALDVHSTVSKSFGNPLPAVGTDALVDIQTRFPRSFTMLLRLRWQADEYGWHPSTESWDRMQHKETSTLRWDITMHAMPTVKLRWRFDYRYAAFGGVRSNEHGFLSFIDASWRPMPWLYVGMRATSFEAASADCAAYSLEVPMPGMSTMLSGSGSGMRLTTSMHFSLGRWCSLYLAAWDQRRNSDHVQGVAVQADFRLFK